MTIDMAREIIAANAGVDWDPFEALMDPDYMRDYTDALNFERAWMDSHVVKKDNRVYVRRKCRKCGGSGFIMSYSHVDHGRCWNCDGYGYIEVLE